MRLKLSLLFSIIYASLWAQPPHTFTANGSVVVPAGITSMGIQAWGGGGAGGGAAGAGLLFGRGAAGGGGGAYAAANITVVAGNTLSVSVAGTTSGTLGDGTAGGSSTILGFESSILAAGGAGGGANTTGNTPAGGTGGTTGTSVGTTKNPGTNGGVGSSALLSLGLTSGAGGTGATPGGGAGGAAISSLILGTGPGNAGTPPGGGGSGAINSALGTAQIGGTGARGQVIVTYTCPNYQINSTSAANVCVTSGTSVVTVTSSAVLLPIGVYTVTYNRSSPAGTALTAPMTITTAGIGTFTASGFTTLGTSNITITSLTSGVCVSNTTTNHTATVTVSPASVGGSVDGGTTICSGFQSAQLTLSGHTGTVVKWQSSVSPFSTWTDIANTATTYTSVALSQTTQFRAVVKSGACDSANSGFTTVTVNPLPTITLGPVAPVCATGLAQNTTLAYTATTNSPTTYSISWNASPANTFAAVTNATLNASPINIAVPAGTAAGTYTGTITVRNANSCTSSPGVAFNVVVNPLPTITLGTVAPVCGTGLAQNTTLAYTATTNSPTTYSISWNASPTNTFAAVTNASLTASPISIAVPAGTAAGTYTGTITVRNANSCTSSAGVAFNVVVNPLPTITLGTAAAVCATGLAQNTTLAYTTTTQTPTTYSIVWNASPANTFAAVTNASLTASPISIAVPAGTAAGTYTGTITVRNANSCTSSPGVAFNVVVNPLPTITLGTVAPVCATGLAQNTTLAYTATTNSPTTYSISWNASPTNTFAAVTNASLTASPISIAVPAGTAAGTYSGTITVRNANSCTSSPGVAFNVVVNPLPTITLGTVAAVCATGLAQNTTLAYTATTNSPTTYSIVWDASPANTFAAVTNATLNASPISIAVPAGTAAGTYTGTITVSNANSCTSSAGVAFNVVVNPLPTITLGTVAAVCATGLAQNTTLAYTATTETPTTYSIVWNASPANTFAVVTNATLNASPISIAVPAGTAAGTYTGTITVSNANSCTSSAGVAFNVVVNPLPTITLGTVAAVCATGLAQNTTLAYTATTNSPTTYSIVWDASPTNTFAAVTNASLTASPISIAVPAGTAAGTYTGILTVANSNSCGSSSGVAFSVDVNPLPTITLGTVAPVCSSASPQNTTLAYTGTTNSPTTYSIVWNASPTNSFVAVTNATLTTSPISIDVPAGTAPGTYTGTLTVANSNSCDSSSGVAFSVDVNPLPTITLGTVEPVCSSVSAQNTTLAYTGTTDSPTTYSIVWNASPANSFVAVTNAILTTSPISIDVPAGTASGTYTGTLTVTNANSCISSPGINFSVLINESPSAPIIGAITPASCTVATGSITLSGLPVGGTLMLYPGEIIQPYSGTTATVSGLSSNTYAFTVSNGICTSVVSANAVVPSLITNTYTTSWSNGTPTADQDIVFAGDFISAGGGAGDITACSCTVNAGVNITIQTLDTLTLTNSLSNNGGSVTFENNASLLQINNAINTGNITYKRTTTPILRGDFVYWSTPVNPQRLFDVSPLTLGDKYLAYNGDRWVITNLNTYMVIGKGYIIRAPQNYSNTDRVTFTASFIGKPNNGDLFGETVAAGKFYLIGNPYPSALNSDLFLSANLFLDGTLYFWTHNTPVPLVGLNRYNSDDYASYNFTGGVGAGTPALTGTPDNNNSTPTGKIGAGQSFFATANNAGTVAFTNSMRLGGIDNSQFFKSENTSNSALLERHRLWLNMTNSEGAFKQTLIGYIEGATNDFESKYDGVTFDGNPYLDFYSIANDNKYVIQGRALPFTDTDVVLLGYRSTIAGDFTISIDHTDGDLSNHAIYIEDKVTNKVHNLKTGNYTFSTSTGTYTDRFVLTYVDKTLGSGEFETNDKNVLVAVQNKVITITSSTEKVETIYIYDLTGKMIYKAANLSDTVVKIDNLKVKNQVLLVKVILETNAAETYKIVY
ncbi:hypothetical protein Q1W71_16380 [Flavobacterium pectinovorum]|uniref:glycine-rich domain-containing protein n=1 Tax=Flavobacterium pectinovorum TaxID=29533 RepID=UPI00265F1FD7|nr:hypothetical protein [Flavobacterium pectinovorum]WKL46532.1 hypothetical protein Q1W71_16380 [Flavobacterium pectinovorum]